MYMYNSSSKTSRCLLGFEALQSLEQLADDVDQVAATRRPVMDMDPPIWLGIHSNQPENIGKLSFNGKLLDLPSSNLTYNYWKWPFIVDFPQLCEITRG